MTIDRSEPKGTTMQLAYHSITWGGVTGSAQGVTSVKDLYYRSNGSVEAAVTDIAAAGYQGTEVFDGNLTAYADRPDVLREHLAANAVELVSVYTGANFVYADILPDEMHRIRSACELASTFGATRLVVGGGARRAAGTPPEDYDRLAKGLDTVVDLAADHGLQASYHPHLTTIVETPEELDRLMERSRIDFCPDTGHLAAGGGDPSELIRRYAERLGHVHLKDIELSTTTFLPLGEGDLDFGDIVGAVRAANYDSWLVVELDSYDGDPRAAAEISRRHLAQILAPA